MLNLLPFSKAINGLEMPVLVEMRRITKDDIGVDSDALICFFPALPWTKLNKVAGDIIIG